MSNSETNCFSLFCDEHRNRKTESHSATLHNGNCAIKYSMDLFYEDCVSTVRDGSVQASTLAYTGIPRYPLGFHSGPHRGCLKPWILATAV